MLLNARLDPHHQASTPTAACCSPQCRSAAHSYAIPTNKADAGTHLTFVRQLQSKSQQLTTAPSQKNTPHPVRLVWLWHCCQHRRPSTRDTLSAPCKRHPPHVRRTDTADQLLLFSCHPALRCCCNADINRHHASRAACQQHTHLSVQHTLPLNCDTPVDAVPARTHTSVTAPVTYHTKHDTITAAQATNPQTKGGRGR